MGEELSDKTTSPARLREKVGEDERRGARDRMREREREREGEIEREESRDCFPNLYVLTKTTYSLKLAKAFTIS